MADSAEMSCSRTYPLSVDEAFAAVLPLPLEQFLDRRYGPIPPIHGTEGDRPWNAVGQTRKIQLADGGSVREELTLVDPPRAFGYRLTEVTGPMKPLASSIDGLWTFEPAGSGGVRITWSWTVHAASRYSAPILPVFARIWREYARQALQRLEDLLVA